MMGITASISGRSDDLVYVTVYDDTHEFNVSLDKYEDCVIIDFGNGKHVTVRYNGCWKLFPSANLEHSFVHEAWDADAENYSDELEVYIDEPCFDVLEYKNGVAREVFE